MESDCSDHSVKSQDSDSDDDDDLLDFESKDLSKVLTDEVCLSLVYKNY